MKKGKEGTRSSARKKIPGSVDEYLARVPEPARNTLKKLRAAIGSAVLAEASETISYGIPAFKHKKVLVMARRVFRPLQSVSHRCGHRRVQGRTEGLLHVQRYHPLPFGQTTADRTDQEAGEGARRASGMNSVQTHSLDV
jgi:hypothetical protein